MKQIADVSGVPISHHYRQDGGIIVDDAAKYQKYLLMKKADDEKDKRIKELEQRIDQLYELLRSKTDN